MTSGDKKFDVVIWGATGFTGEITAEYLLEKYGVAETLRWALGGRNREKLERVREAIGHRVGVESSAIPLVVGDAGDASSMTELARSTRVVCTTVGPYALYGSPLVAACAQEGTDYCDLTGEIQWIRRMIDSHQAQAQASGARLVPTSGFDCIPSDLGVFFLHQEMQKRHGVPCSQIKLRVNGFSGGASGGTIASMMVMMDEAARDPEVGQLMRDPYALNPEGLAPGLDGADLAGAAWDADFNQWTGPFVMAAMNTRIVRRSNALLGHAYGKEFRYDEATLTGSGPGGFAKAAGLAASLGGGMAAMSIGPLRRFLHRRLPQPGEGPSRKQREAGYWDLLLWGRHPDDPSKNIRGRVQGDRDPGYGSTAKMLAESAVGLALDPRETGGGFFTPAAAMGSTLLDRLESSAGVTFSIESD